MQQVHCSLGLPFCPVSRKTCIGLGFYHRENWTVDLFKISQVPGKVRQTKTGFCWSCNQTSIPIISENRLEFILHLSITLSLPGVQVPYLPQIDRVLVAEFVFTCFSVLSSVLFQFFGQILSLEIWPGKARTCPHCFYTRHIVNGYSCTVRLCFFLSEMLFTIDLCLACFSFDFIKTSI